MRILLILLFAAILIAMIAVTAAAWSQRGILDAGSELMSHRWFVATLCDAYFGFVTFFVWVAYKERTAGRRMIWFVLIMGLGNIAMAVYMLIQLTQHPRGAPLSMLLDREDDAAPKIMQARGP